MNKYIEDILSDTTEINSTQRTIRSYLDDKGNEFFTIFYNEDMFIDYGETYPEGKTVVISGEEVLKILEEIKTREEEL